MSNERKSWAKEDAVHLRHCNQGDGVGVCAYGYEDCPAVANPEWIKAYWEENGLLRESVRSGQSSLPIIAGIGIIAALLLLYPLLV